MFAGLPNMGFDPLPSRWFEASWTFATRKRQRDKTVGSLLLDGRHPETIEAIVTLCCKDVSGDEKNHNLRLDLHYARPCASFMKLEPISNMRQRGLNQC